MYPAAMLLLSPFSPRRAAVRLGVKIKSSPLSLAPPLPASTSPLAPLRM